MTRLFVQLPCCRCGLFDEGSVLLSHPIHLRYCTINLRDSGTLSTDAPLISPIIAV